MQQVKSVTVIGLGLIGGSLCRAIRRVHPQIRLTGVDFPEICAQARELDFVDAAFEPRELARACETADLIFIATPITAAKQILRRLPEVAARQVLVTDVCSVKGEILSLAQEAFRRSEILFIGGHPMAGAEKPGLEHADPFLFENALYILTPPPGTPDWALHLLAGLISDLGARVVVEEATVHDRIAAAVSHLPQMLAVALMNFVAEKNAQNPLYLNMAAGGFRDMTRIASSPFHIWEDILRDNRGNILREMQGFIEYLQAHMARFEPEDLRRSFEAAARNRLSIPTDMRGFLRPHYDISVEVEDRPGIIAALSGALAEAGINIKDIEVLKVRENEGGTLRLAFESREARARALEILSAKGFRCRER